MGAILDENKLLGEKVRKLERENFWIMRIGIAAVVLSIVGFLVLHHSIHGEVTAEQFILKDTNGQTRADLALSPEGPALELYSASGEPRAQLVGGGEDASLNLYFPSTASRSRAASLNFFMEKTLISSFSVGADTTALNLHSATGAGAATMSVQAGKTEFTLTGSGKNALQVSMEADANHSCSTVSSPAEPAANGSLCLESVGLPALTVADREGNKAVLGVADFLNPRTGKPKETSAASLVLEQQNGKGIWSAPR
jgi:hypothetical protein